MEAGPEEGEGCRGVPHLQSGLLPRGSKVRNGPRSNVGLFIHELLE